MKKNKNLSKIVPTEDVKLLILNNELLPIRTIDSTLKKLSTKIIPNYYNEKNKKKKDEIWEKILSKHGNYFLLFANHYSGAIETDSYSYV
jgi:hypothetical protein